LKNRSYQQSEVANQKYFSSGSVFDCAGLVESLLNRSC
jgi:hypothetical protein